MLKKRIWAIFKISYNPAEEKAEGGVCGSCFFIGRNRFITANHCFNQNVFQPNKGYKKTKVVLANWAGEIIENPEVCFSKPKYDFVVGKVTKSVKDYLSLNGATILTDQKVFNLGYSGSEALKSSKFLIKNSELEISHLSLDIEKQEGKVRDVKAITVNANDIKFSNLKVAILSYTSEMGFSGGPLFNTDGNQLIAFMSMVVPPKYDLLKPAVAIPLCHWRNLL